MSLTPMICITKTISQNLRSFLSNSTTRKVNTRTKTLTITTSRKDNCNQWTSIRRCHRRQTWIWIACRFRAWRNLYRQAREWALDHQSQYRRCPGFQGCQKCRIATLTGLHGSRPPSRAKDSWIKICKCCHRLAQEAQRRNKSYGQGKNHQWTNEQTSQRFFPSSSSFVKGYYNNTELINDANIIWII